jgi:hypothetical protein
MSSGVATIRALLTGSLSFTNTRQVICVAIVPRQIVVISAFFPCCPLLYFPTFRFADQGLGATTNALRDIIGCLTAAFGLHHGGESTSGITVSDHQLPASGWRLTSSIRNRVSFMAANL